MCIRDRNYSVINGGMLLTPSKIIQIAKYRVVKRRGEDFAKVSPFLIATSITSFTGSRARKLVTFILEIQRKGQTHSYAQVTKAHLRYPRGLWI